MRGQTETPQMVTETDGDCNNNDGTVKILSFKPAKRQYSIDIDKKRAAVRTPSAPTGARGRPQTNGVPTPKL